MTAYPLHVCSSCDFGLKHFPFTPSVPPFFFLFFISLAHFFFFFETHSLSDGRAVRDNGGDVFPPARLPAVLKCLPGGVRERETGSAYAFIPGREQRNRWKSVRHRSSRDIGVRHVRQPVCTQLQRFFTVHQRGLGPFLANGKNACFVLLCLEKCAEGCYFCRSEKNSHCLYEHKRKNACAFYEWLFFCYLTQVAAELFDFCWSLGLFGCKLQSLSDQ